MIISPKTHKTCANERRVLLIALNQFIQHETRRRDRLINAQNIDAADDNIARAFDLAAKFAA